MRLVALSLAALSVACGGPTVGELISQEVSFTVRAVSSDPSEVAVGEPDGGRAVTRAYVSTSAVTLLPCNEGVASLELEPRGYELVAESPDRERITTAVQNFCCLRLDVEPNEEDVSLQVEGTDVDGAPFTISSAASFSLLLETKEDESFGNWPLILGVDVATWLDGLPLAEDMSDLASSALEEQLAGAVSLYLDEDEDGVLDAEESRPILRARVP
jgi:hypothetical protein